MLILYIFECYQKYFSHKKRAHGLQNVIFYGGERGRARENGVHFGLHNKVCFNDKCTLSRKYFVL